MELFVDPALFSETHLSTAALSDLLQAVQLRLKDSNAPREAWPRIASLLREKRLNFEFYLIFFTLLYPNWRSYPENAPAWIPSITRTDHANISKIMRILSIDTVSKLHEFSVKQADSFWQMMLSTLSIKLGVPAHTICDLSSGIKTPHWLAGAKMNIIDSCLGAAPQKTAILYAADSAHIHSMSYEQLGLLTNQIANSLVQIGIKPGEVVGIIMPMRYECIAIYLAIIKMGAVVVSIADSFSGEEILHRLKIANAKAIFIQNEIRWEGKIFPLYQKIFNATSTHPLDIHASHVIVLGIEDQHAFDCTCKQEAHPVKRKAAQNPPLMPIEGATWFNDFLVDKTEFDSFLVEPMSPTHILFSSGTTGEPKAIVWNHTTAIKAASDAYFHQDIKSNDVLAWPTNLGWMMGPWLIFAALIHRATMAIYTEAPKNRDFGLFIEQARVTMLGVVPTLVNTWRQTHCMENLNWEHIQTFSSTAECSHPEDYFYLMYLGGGNQPIIEYCGGTEIGGGYISSTVIQDNCLSCFSTATMGLDFCLIDSQGQISNSGEVAIIPPALGLSTTLLNADHDQIYFAHMPKLNNTPLRRHGDQLKQCANGYYSVLGRNDDTMKLGGIKTSAAEIERCLVGLPHIVETAAIAITPPNGGLSQLIIYVVADEQLEVNDIQTMLQQRISAQLNPLFKIHEVKIIPSLPKTASNKIMRRMLRDHYTIPSDSP